MGLNNYATEFRIWLSVDKSTDSLVPAEVDRNPVHAKWQRQSALYETSVVNREKGHTPRKLDVHKKISSTKAVAYKREYVISY